MPTETAGSRRDVQYQTLLALLGEHRSDSGSTAPVLKASRMRSIVNCHRLAAAYKERSRVAYVTEQFPTEIVFAFDAIPWNVESMAIMLAQSLDVNRIFELTQERELSRDICSFLRGPYGMALADGYPRPDLVLANDQPCEGLSKLMFMLGRHYQAPVFSLHSPNIIDDDSVNYLVRQMEQMIADMQQALGVPLAPDALRLAVERSNQARDYFLKTAALLQTHALPGVSRELQEIFGMNYFGAPENVRICQALYDEAVQLAASPATRRKRILWIGQVPEESHELLRHINEVVDVIYWAPLWEANAVMLDAQTPLSTIAHRAMLYHWNAARMREDTLRIADAFGIDGFLIVNVWGCRNMMGMTPVLRDIAALRRRKCVTINIDLVDRNNYAFNHVKNRVDAFLELVQ